MRYLVKITETLERVVPVDAECPEMAEDAANEQWRASDIILDAEDFTGVTFSAQTTENKL